MELGLKLILEEAGLSKEVIANVEKVGVKKAATFATYVSEPADVSRFVRGLTFEGESEEDKHDARDSALSMLRLAWLQAKANLEHGLKRKASGLMEEVPDGPLPADLHQSLVDAACKHYDWDCVDLSMICTDSVVGKLRREFQAHAHTTFPLVKATSQAAASHSHASSKKQRLTDRLCLLDEMAEPEDDAKGHVCLLDLLENFERLTVTWSVVGCYLVPDPTKEDQNATCLYVRQCEVDSYRREFSLEATSLRRFFTDGSSVKYLVAVEETMRSEANKNSRPPKKRPYSKALLASVESKASAWTKHRNLLVPKQEHPKKNPQTAWNQPPVWKPQGVSASTSSSSGADKGKGKGGNKSKDKGGKEKQATTQDGVRACYRFNGKQGCPDKACRFAHICNFILPSGFLCGKKHTRAEHERPGGNH